MNVSYCNICGDFLFNGRHGGQVEIRCRAIRDPVADETINAALTNETINSVPVAETIIQPPTHETITVRRGRPRTGTATETITATKPWTAAGMSRATWYRRMKAV
jgi:hypothetical protein